MKKLLLVLMGLSIFTSCFVDPVDVRQQVIQDMGTIETVSILGTKYEFISRKKDGSIWYIRYNNGIGKLKTTQLLDTYQK